jgi:hypothetical protein
MKIGKSETPGRIEEFTGAVYPILSCYPVE